MDAFDNLEAAAQQLEESSALTSESSDTLQNARVGPTANFFPAGFVVNIFQQELHKRPWSFTVQLKCFWALSLQNGLNGVEASQKEAQASLARQYSVGNQTLADQVRGRAQGEAAFPPTLLGSERDAFRVQINNNEREKN